MSARARSLRGRIGLLAATVLAPLALWALLPMVGSGATPQSKLDEIQRDIEETQGKIGKRKGSERVLTSEISGYTARIVRLEGRISELQLEQSAAQSDLDAKQAELDRIQGELRFQRQRLVRLRARLAVAREALANRLVELYQADQPDLVTVILSSKGFAELLERGEFMKRVSDQDRRIVELVRSARGDATSAEHELTGLERKQRTVTAAVAVRRDEIADAKAGLVGVRAELDGVRQTKRNRLLSIRDERHALEGDLSELRAKQAEITATLQQAQGTLPAGPIKAGSGQLIWPVNGPITSPFCETRSWESCHPGIDIGVPSGTPIRAAAAGTVAILQGTGASGGYGNFTCIQHGGELSTCYAHQSSFATSMGASVGQGQVIGYVGCTGLCFGDHLHFEVRVNGSVTNPMAYL